MLIWKLKNLVHATWGVLTLIKVMNEHAAVLSKSHILSWKKSDFHGLGVCNFNITTDSGVHGGFLLS